MALSTEEGDPTYLPDWLEFVGLSPEAAIGNKEAFAEILQVGVFILMNDQQSRPVIGAIRFLHL